MLQITRQENPTTHQQCRVYFPATKLYIHAFVPMSKLLLNAMLLAVCGAGYGHTPAQPAVHSPNNVQQRRAAVRAVLQAQQHQKPADDKAARRQLSLKERQALRQQLRQQRG